MSAVRLRLAQLRGSVSRLRSFPSARAWPISFRARLALVAAAAVALTEVDHSLGRIENLLILIAGSGIAIAAGFGLLVSRAALAPVRRLTAATENVTETGDLSERITVSGRDELSRLAGSFNTMLGALEESSRAQRHLVADASHERRRPLRAPRTIVEGV